MSRLSTDRIQNVVVLGSEETGKLIITQHLGVDIEKENGGRRRNSEVYFREGGRESAT